jgi:hypothetical protein
MKKFVLATLAILGVVLGTVNLSMPANAMEGDVNVTPSTQSNGQG